MNRTRAAAAAATLATATLALSACSASSGGLPDLPAPTFDEVTVHDPSVVTAGDDVWVFGSHAASAHTTDLMSWTQNSMSVGDADAAGLFDDIRAELAETFAWAQSDTLWAADVVELPDGRYAMYYNACEGSSARSALGLAIADSVEGPYVNQQILLRSGMWDEESENAGEVYDATVHPNTVDPDAFYDEDGDLWMVYGSYSGGIFILEMDEETGLPVEGQGYGEHLVGGNHSRIEAPSIRYDEETGYYYLFLSFGGLDASGGYEVRVARSESPDGPYVDAEGNAMADVAGAPGTVFDDASIEPYGVKLVGGFEWADGPGMGGDQGYVSPGHNSWYDDPETGESFLVFHSRFASTGEIHEVRVHQMYMNAEGWPVLAPARYAGEGLAAVSADDAAGTYQVVLFDKVISPFVPTSVAATLEADGTVSGGLEGTWELGDDAAVTVTTAAATFSGVVAPVWNPTAAAWTWGLTVVSEGGVPLWGRQDGAGA
ncbi:glycoside hydrolase family 43 protein [Demequina sp. SYSU T00192]|uniref:Glycoside hydrolase family 43 protein n=1 Tax=Demequina litoralis TaxID=3051660 RepID=A0ABT8GC52_9MICO|nr:glycoside hydrolase family 43 protein [Demequina sp. SYSU T00192]MDN4476708.1 glycoside hydrolase family 43 protein [Demequina sp. SYSU T00192]